ncbi:MAG: hypothetical protein FWH54_04745 [Methanobrevibacter sp.]|nr:hypothetical protein [Methanobrevibacter sp.]
MVKYDDASWHYGGDFPKDLTEENAATHIGMFLVWCINNDLISDELKEISKKDIDDVKSRKMTGSEFLFKICDEKFIDCDLSEFGQKFTNDYYEDSRSKFARKFGEYIRDLADIFNEKAEKNGFEYETLYHVENTWENYDLIAKKLDERFVQWKNFKKK